MRSIYRLVNHFKYIFFIFQTSIVFLVMQYNALINYIIIYINYIYLNIYLSFLL